ncbi:MAG TPA: EpsG family protein [Candidatus Phocaeicola gallinarum]|nr:EpsG family protein [Candidatus Phocaeicola gallinarum]
MYLYFFFGILAFISGMEVANIKIKQYPAFYKVTYWCFIWIFFLLSSFRWKNGTDWNSYLLFFNSFTDITCISYMEPGFTLLTSVNSTLFNYTAQLTSIAFLSIIPIAWRYNKISPYPIFTLFIWYTTTFANIFPVRQSIAIALFVFSWKYIQEKRIKPFLFFVFLGAMFHFTVLITIPIYYLWHKKIPTAFYCYSILILAGISFLSDSLIKNILFGIGGDLLKEKLEFYLEANQDSTFNSSFTPAQILFRGIINRSFYFFIPLILLRKYRHDNPSLNAFFNLYFYSFCLFLVFTPLAPAMGRLCNYTDMSQALLLPYIFTLKMNRTNICLIMCIIILYFTIRFKGVVGNYYDAYIPYNFVFFQ